VSASPSIASFFPSPALSVATLQYPRCLSHSPVSSSFLTYRLFSLVSHALFFFVLLHLYSTHAKPPSSLLRIHTKSVHAIYLFFLGRLSLHLLNVDFPSVIIVLPRIIHRWRHVRRGRLLNRRRLPQHIRRGIRSGRRGRKGWRYRQSNRGRCRPSRRRDVRRTRAGRARAAAVSASGGRGKPSAPRARLRLDD
jgi:hypothetical protein